MADVRVLIVGQDPYPTPGHPVGLSFSVSPETRPIPRSLQNIFREYRSDLGLPAPANGDLSRWADHGVLLLNRVLTVQPGRPGSHRGRGWEEVTACAIAALVQRGGPLVAVLWGRDAQSLEPHLGAVPVVSSPHPSPMSADRGFFGSRPFSRVGSRFSSGREPRRWTGGWPDRRTTGTPQTPWQSHRLRAGPDPARLRLRGRDRLPWPRTALRPPWP